MRYFGYKVPQEPLKRWNIVKEDFVIDMNFFILLGSSNKWKIQKIIRKSNKSFKKEKLSCSIRC